MVELLNSIVQLSLKKKFYKAATEKANELIHGIEGKDDDNDSI